VVIDLCYVNTPLTFAYALRTRLFAGDYVIIFAYAFRRCAPSRTLRDATGATPSLLRTALYSSARTGRADNSADVERAAALGYGADIAPRLLSRRHFAAILRQIRKR